MIKYDENGEAQYEAQYEVNYPTKSKYFTDRQRDRLILCTSLKEWDDLFASYIGDPCGQLPSCSCKKPGIKDDIFLLIVRTLLN